MSNFYRSVLSPSPMPKLLLLIVLAVSITLAYVYRDLLAPELIRQWVGGGAVGALTFTAIYIAAVLLFLPGSLLTLLGGFIFGPWWGFLINLSAATVGAGLSFLVSRYIAADWANRRASGVLSKLKTGVEAEGWRFVAFTRLVPLFPFNLINYAFGLTRIPFWQYLLATFVCMMPGAFVYTWLGHVGQGALLQDKDWLQQLLLGLSALSALVYATYWLKTRKMRRFMESKQVK